MEGRGAYRSVAELRRLGELSRAVRARFSSVTRLHAMQVPTPATLHGQAADGRYYLDSSLAQIPQVMTPSPERNMFIALNPKTARSP